MLKNEERKIYILFGFDGHKLNTALCRSVAYNIVGKERRGEGTKRKFRVSTCCTWYTTAATYLLQVFGSDPCVATPVRVSSYAAQFMYFVLSVDTATLDIGRSLRFRLRSVTRFSMFSFPRMFFDYPSTLPPPRIVPHAMYHSNNAHTICRFVFI